MCPQVILKHEYGNSLASNFYFFVKHQIFTTTFTLLLRQLRSTHLKFLKLFNQG